MHHVVFVPGLGPARQKLEQCGLGADFADRETFGFELTDRESPTGDPGVMVTWDNIASPQPSEAKSLAWLPAVKHEGQPSGRYLVGVDPDALPTPFELVRTDQVAGRRVQLGQHSWTIASLGEFPLSLCCTDDGFGYSVPRSLAHYWEHASHVRKLLADAKEGEVMDITDACWLVIDNLNLNYRLPRELVGPLELLTSGEGGTLLAAAYAALWDGPDETSVVPATRLRRGGLK